MDKRVKYPLTNDQIEWFKNHYSSNGINQSAIVLKMSKHSCRKLAGKLKLRVSKDTKSEILRDNAIRQFSVVREKRNTAAKFIEISTAEQAYSLGFLWGDGHLVKANTKTDLYYVNCEILEDDFTQILPYLRSIGEWSGHVRKRNKKATFNAVMCDPVFGLFLKNHDYDVKSLENPSKILSAIPEQLHHLFWRGYIDADGCFYVRKGSSKGTFTIVGDINQKWDVFKNILSSLGIKYSCEKRKQKKGSSSCITIYNANGINDLGEYLFKDNKGICLQRKLNKLNLIKR